MLFQIHSYRVASAVIAVALALAILAVIGRFYVRSSSKQRLRMDDWLVLPGLLLIIGMDIATYYGIGQEALWPRIYSLLHPGHVLSGMMRDKYRMAKQIELSVILMAILALTVIKSSFLCFYHRTFVYDKTNPRDIRNIIICSMLGITILWGLSFFILFLSSCGRSLRTYWSTTTSHELETKCLNPLEAIYALAISDFVTDCLIIVIPIPMIWRLRLQPSRKVGVLAVFLLGSLASLMSLLRLLWARDVIHEGSKVHSHDDPLSLISAEIFWYILECEIALTAACLPALAGLRRSGSVGKVIRSVQSKLSLRSNNSNNNEPKNMELPMSSNNIHVLQKR